eukprot:scaffold87649_cov52-Phaeocystis_antarctica.AAC.3
MAAGTVASGRTYCGTSLMSACMSRPSCSETLVCGSPGTSKPSKRARDSTLIEASSRAVV